jgi:hypothetical protein
MGHLGRTLLHLGQTKRIGWLCVGKIRMAEYNISLRSWHAVLGAFVVVGFLSLQSYLRMRTVDDGMQTAMREKLLNEYSGRSAKDVSRLLAEARDGEPVEPLPEVVPRDVEFTSLGAHGKIGARVILVRAELKVDGTVPPDGRSIRYFQLSRKFMESGWMVVGESNSYSYYRELLP